MGTMVYRPDGATIMLALLTQEKALDVSPEHFHVSFTKPDASPVSGSMCVKIKRNTTFAAAANGNVNQPGAGSVVQALEATGEINGKLIWSNTVI